MKRRVFAKLAGLGALSMHALPTLVVAEMSSTLARIPLGLCNHSLRSLQLNARQLIEYAIEQKLDSVLLNTFQPFESLEKPYLTNLKSLAQSSGISIYIGASSISEKSPKFSKNHKNAKNVLSEGIRVAATVGSPIVGCRIGNIDDRYSEGGIKEHIDAVIKVMKSMRSQALDAGVKFAFENHAGDLRSKELLELINETGTEICGALFDPANSVWAMEDPMRALKVLGENIICTSVCDIIAWETEEGATFQGMAIGEGMIDFRFYAKTMAELCPGVPLHVETISNSARPIPFLKSEFWKGFPNLSAKDIVDFLKLIKNGSQQEIIKPPANKNKRTFDIELQQSELLSSFNYLRKNCNAGVKK
ncbi:MAG: TIM barrel protein [Bacteroidetes bacterium]|nr:TIM barrel protein [Bacteroidota bacterium]